MLRIGDFKVFHIWQYLGRSISVSIYVLSCWLIHAWFKLRRFKSINPFHMPLSIILGIITVLIISYFHVFFIPAYLQMPEFPFEPTLTDFSKRLTQGFILCMTSYIVFNTVFANHMLNQTQLENEHFKQAHLRAQLLSLQQQISPHFLFNSLSTLKSITKEIDTKQFVIQLSHVYRYLLNINDSPTTKLAEELNFIKSYLYILDRRFGTALQVSVNVPDEYLNHLVPPLSIQLLIENAIKHNVISPDFPLCIGIYVNDNVELIVTNSNQPKKIPVESTRLGLQNIKDRYLLLFEKNISIEHTKESFNVTLPLIPYERYHY
jgi:two-component system LytT family sensor kinase